MSQEIIEELKRENATLRHQLAGAITANLTHFPLSDSAVREVAVENVKMKALADRMITERYKATAHLTVQLDIAKKAAQKWRDIAHKLPQYEGLKKYKLPWEFDHFKKREERKARDADEFAYTCDRHAEVLCCDPEEAIEEHLSSEPGYRPKMITVYRFKRLKFDRAWVTDDVLDHLREWLWDIYGNPDDCDDALPEHTEKFARVLIDHIADGYTVWQCEHHDEILMEVDP